MNSIQGQWHTWQDDRQGSGTTAFDQFSEGNNGSQFDIKILDSKGCLIATVPAAGKSGYSKVNAHKNANLISNAPEMSAEIEQLKEQRDELLEALLDARFALYGNGPGNPKIDAAIAKATSK